VCPTVAIPAADRREFPTIAIPAADASLSLRCCGLKSAAKAAKKEVSQRIVK